MPIEITQRELDDLTHEFGPLLGLKIDWLSVPKLALPGFEPSQIAVIINTLLDAALPQITLLATDPENAEKLRNVGLYKSAEQIGQRESYPDYIHSRSGKRVELKGLFVDNPALDLKRPPTQREPSARLKENITKSVIDPANDALLVAAVQLQEIEGRCYPVIIDLTVVSMIECIRARDERLLRTGGKWFGGTPKVISRRGAMKIRSGERFDDLGETDFEKDTNFGKLKRIPYEPLQDFMRKHGVT